MHSGKEDCAQHGRCSRCKEDTLAPSHRNQEKRRQGERNDLDSRGGAEECAGAGRGAGGIPNRCEEQSDHGRIGITVKSGQKDRGWRSEEKEGVFAGFFRIDATG